MGLGIDRTLISTPAEIVDLVSCYAIANGAREMYTYTFDEILEMK